MPEARAAIEAMRKPTKAMIDLNPDRLLRSWESKLERVLIIGVGHDGEEIFASSIADGMEMLWMVERFKQALMTAADESDE